MANNIVILTFGDVLVVSIFKSNDTVHLGTKLKPKQKSHEEKKNNKKI